MPGIARYRTGAHGFTSSLIFWRGRIRRKGALAASRCGKEAAPVTNNTAHYFYTSNSKQRSRNRKAFIRNTGFATASLAVLPAAKSFALAAGNTVRTALIGIGARGMSHLDLLLRRPGVEPAAVCDVEERATAGAKALEAGSKALTVIFNGRLTTEKRLANDKTFT